MEKIKASYQKKWENYNLFNPSILKRLEVYGIKIHNEIENVMSSQAACFNVFDYLSKRENKNLLINFLRKIGIEVDDIFEFPSGSIVVDKEYKDEGMVIFEWIGPQASVINEGNSGGRGHRRTSTDAFCLALIKGRVTQILIEWKFTEHYENTPQINRFSGGRGIERLKRYSTLVAKYRSTREQLFDIKDDDEWGLGDLGYEPFYQLLRFHLLGRETIGIEIGKYKIEDYRILHLSHSKNDSLNILKEEHIKYSPRLEKYLGRDIHIVWKDLLSDDEKGRFIGGYWNEALKGLDNSDWYKYCEERYL